jgi:uroporphyrin-III C-methyltransferase
MAGRGIVYLVGAGPGDPGLITVRALELLRKADVVVHDRLVATELLAEAQPCAEVVYVGKTPGIPRPLAQERIHELLADRARRGLTVVRLKGGDPFVFGRGFEELIACRAAGIDCVVVPGVTSALAGPAAAGIPLTIRGSVQSLAMVTAQTADSDSVPPLDFKALAGVDAVIVLMGRRNLAAVAQAMIDGGRPPETPAACIEQATTPQQRVSTGMLQTIAETVERDKLKAPVVTIVGEVAVYARDLGADALHALVRATQPAPSEST